MLDVAYSSACNGCHACYATCPTAAIRMKENAEGFLFPVIDVAKCISCGKCELVCPVLHPPVLRENAPKTYACRNKNDLIRLESSSGGIFTLLAEKIVAEDGVVFGAKFRDDFSVIHDWTDSVEGIASFRTSKYVQSTIGDTFSVCKQFLEKGRKVLFSGTPCQIAGLKAFLGKDFDSLFYVDLICHGVPSPTLWKKYVAYHEAQSGSRIVRTSFRRKDFGWKRFSLSFFFANGSEYLKTLDKDPYMQMFLRNLCLRPSCFECSFKTISRISDITLADFWNVEHVLPDLDDDTGTSLVFVHSPKGNDMMASIFNNVACVPVQTESVVRFNSAMIKSAVRPAKRERFFTDMQKMPFSKFIKVYSKDKFYIRLYTFVHCRIGKIKHRVIGK